MKTEKIKTEKAVKLYNSITNMKDEIVEETQMVKLKRKKSAWVKWSTVAACLAHITVIGYGALLGDWFRAGSYIVTLDNGDTIKFVKSDEISSRQSSVDYYAEFPETTRDMTKKEIDTLFHGLPISAFGYFSNSEHKLVGLEGNVGNIKLIVASQERKRYMLDTVIDGSEERTKVYGVPVTAGYFLTNRNSKGARRYICYASFELGDNTFYVENAGQENRREKVSSELAKTIQDLINNGEFDLS